MCSEFSREKRDRGKVNEKVKRTVGMNKSSSLGDSLRSRSLQKHPSKVPELLSTLASNGVQERSLPEMNVMFVEQQKWMACVTGTVGSARVVSPLSFPQFILLCVMSWDKDQRRK